MNTAGFYSLLADRSLLRDMGSGFRDKREHFDATDLVFWFFIVIGVFVLIAIAARLLAGTDKHRHYNSPRALFRALCRAHQLDRSAQRLLRKLARSQQLTPPARIFLEPGCFLPEGLSPSLKAQEQAIARLHEKLFASGDEPQSASV